MLGVYNSKYQFVQSIGHLKKIKKPYDRIGKNYFNFLLFIAKK